MGCGQPCIGFYCYLCTCQQCGFSLRNGTCINCTFGDGKPVTCCECESLLNGGFCLFCNSRAGNSSAYDPNPNSYNDSLNFSDYTPQPQYDTYFCELCGNDAHYGYDCPPQVPIISNPEPCYNQNYDEFPQNIPNLQSINEELAEYINTLSWNLPTSSYDDDDDEYSFATQEYLMTCSTAITLDSPKMDFLIMSEDECECDVPDCDDSQTINFSTYSNPLFDDSTSSNDELSHEEDIHEMSFITHSNPLFNLDEEIISSKYPDSTPKNDRFDAEFYLLESLLNHDTLMTSSPKIDSLFDEFADELKTIPPGIDSDSLREEIDIFPGPDDSIPPGIESDDYDSEDDDNSTSLPEFESFHVDYPDSGDSTIDVVEDIPVDVPNILPTHPTLHMDFDFIPSHNDLGSDLDVSSPSGDRNKIYDPGICIEVESTEICAFHDNVISVPSD
ncbi:hypothetical protein Tco_0026051 [Tanacetum coccineum]